MKTASMMAVVVAVAFASVAHGLSGGNRIKAASGGINVRDASLAPLFVQNGGMHGTITSGPISGTAGGYSGNWWRIRWDAQPPQQGSTEGWCAESVLSLAPSAGDIAKPDFALAYYTTANHFWTRGYAPASTLPPSSNLGTSLGNCTWYAYGRMLQLGYSATHLYSIAPPGSADAPLWDDNARANGIQVDDSPSVGSIAQTDSGSGHVAVVESINADGTITVSESSYVLNTSSSWNFLWCHRTVSPLTFQRYIHVPLLGAGCLPAPVLTAPTQGSIGQPLLPVFTWSPVAGANAGYRILVATNPSDLPTSPTADAGGSSVIINATSSTPSYTPSVPLIPGVTYHWIVHARSSAQFGTWSAKTSFTTLAQPTGTLRVTITPPPAISAGAAWRRVGTSTWFGSGDIEAGIPVGSYAVEFKSLSGWIVPANRACTIVANACSGDTGSYSIAPQTGSLLVMLEPSAATQVGAQWQVDGGPWQPSGALVSGLLLGSHILAFRPVAGYAAPSVKTVSVSLGQTTISSATYTPLSQAGSLRVTISPEAAVLAGALWRRVGTSTWFRSGDILDGIPIGAYSIEFLPVSGWSSPANRSGTIIANACVSESGTYAVAPPSGSLTTTISPAAAAAAGALWRVDGGLWLSGGASVPGLSVGNHLVEFKPVLGYVTPVNQTVSIINGRTATISGIYPTAAQAGTLQFTATSYSAAEDRSAATSIVARIGGSAGLAKVMWSTYDGTAVAGQDYAATGGTLMWNDGDTTPKLIIVPLTNDSVPEAQESVGLQLFGASGATLGGATSATLLIAPNDQPASGSVDLAILGLSLSPATPAPGAAVAAYVTVKNLGTAPASAGYVDVWINRGGAGSPGQRGDRYSSVGTLAAGETKVVPVTGLIAPLVVGTYTMRAVVDSQNQQAETDENNNEAVRAYQTSTALPDFVITTIAASYSRSTVNLVLDVKNVAPVAGDAGVAQVMPAVESTPALVQYLWVGPIAAGQTVRRIYPMPAVLAAGSHIIWAKVDCYGLTSERDEDNNANAAVYYSR